MDIFKGIILFGNENMLLLLIQNNVRILHDSKTMSMGFES